MPTTSSHETRKTLNEPNARELACVEAVFGRELCVFASFTNILCRSFLTFLFSVDCKFSFSQTAKCIEVAKFSTFTD